MLLTVDIGNTTITLGFHRDGTVGPCWRLATERNRTPDEYGITMLQLFSHAGVRTAEVEGIALASVVPSLTDTILRACERYIGPKPLVVDVGVKTGVRLKYDEPKQIGADRVVDAAAVRKLYGGPACIVDFGTASTFDAISADGDYLGGAIAPGLEIAADALFQSAAKLPRVELRRPPSAVGRNTVQSIQSGLLFGYVALVEGMVARFRAELGPAMKVIGTGAIVEVIACETDVIEIVAPWLTLDGLAIIYEMNRGG